MHKICLFIITFIVLNSCGTDKNGLWIQGYSTMKHSGEQFNLRGDYLLDFYKDSLKKVYLVKDGFSRNLSIETLDYNAASFEITTDNGKRRFDFNGGECFLEGENSEVAYLKLPEQWKNEHTLNLNGVYRIKSVNLDYFYEFINDSLCFLYDSSKFENSFRFNQYKIHCYKGYQFFTINNISSPVEIIAGNKEEMTWFCPHVRTPIQLNDFSEAQVSRIEHKKTPQINLEGNWVENNIRYFDTNFETDSIFEIPKDLLPPQPPGQDRNKKVKFNPDSAFYFNKSYKWQLSESGNRIYFLKSHSYNCFAWKIESYSDSKLLIRIPKSGGKFNLVEFLKED